MIATRPARPADLAAIAQLLDAVEEHDGVAPVGEVGRLALTAGKLSEFFVAIEGEGDPVARTSTSGILGSVWTDGQSAELAVLPQHRRRGIGTALIDTLVSAHPLAKAWAHGRVPGAAEFARARGGIPVRELLHMTWLAGDAVVPPVPDGWEVRTFTPADAAAWVALNAEIFADHPEQGSITEADLAARMTKPWFDPRLFWLVVNELGGLAGYAWMKPGAGGADELYVIGLAASARGTGLAAHLVGRVQEATAARGSTSLGLYVEAGNKSAVRSYERAGFHTDGVDLQYARGR